MQRITILVLAVAVAGAVACQRAEQRMESVEVKTDILEKDSKSTDLPRAEDVASKLEGLLNEKLGTHIRDLELGFQDGALALSGVCDSEATKRLAMDLAKQFEGVATVSVENLAVEAGKVEPSKVEAQKAEVGVYVVQRDDSLSKIAEKYYDDPMKYPVIIEANPEVIQHADRIYPGQTLRVPQRED